MRIVISVAIMGLALCWATAGWAQSGDSAAVDARGLIAAGQADEAIKQLTRLLKSDSASDQDLAKAFYQRGLAYEALEQHANAIADFTSALWLKGLSSQERADAQRQRAAAYRTLGISPAGDAVAGGGDALGRTASLAPFQTRVEAAAEPTPPAAAPRSRSPAAETPPPSPNPPPSAEPSQEQEDSEARQIAEAEALERETERESSRLARFFSNILPARGSDAAPAPAAAPAPSWSGSTEVRAVPPSPTPPPAASWGASTQTRPETPPPVAAPRPAPSAPTVTAWRTETSARTPEASSAAPSGRSYRLQLASVRSESEAQEAWQRIAARHASIIGGREPTFERTDLGELGVFYRVQIGPFADRAEPLRLCNALKQGGGDCLLVAQ